MPAGFSDAALELGAAAMVNRSFLIRLHTGDICRAPAGALQISNGYLPEHIAQGGVTSEGTSNTEARFSNTADVDFGTAASGGGWGNVSWISVWYNATDEDAGDPADATARNAFSTCFAVMQLQTAQTVNANDPFVIRARTIDFISTNAA